MNSGIVIKRGQYARDKKTGRRFPRIKTVADLLRLLEYFEDEVHPNHEGIQVTKTKFWQCSMEDFSPSVNLQADAYRAMCLIGKPGKRWSGDIAEHIIVAPPPSSALTERERSLIAEGVLKKISPFSPAAYVWHYDEEEDRWDLHLAISAFEDGYPRLRVAEVRNRHAADYRYVLDETTADIVHALNAIRAHEDRLPINTLGGLTVQKTDDLVAVLTAIALRRQLKAPTISDLHDLFDESCHWKIVKHSKTSITVHSADYSTPLHVRWVELLRAVADGVSRRRDVRGKDDPGLEI